MAKGNNIKRDSILDAAYTLFINRGYYDTKIIDIADAAAVGDTYNDIPMLERVGHSFIVDNAEEHMNAHAKWRIPSNNDGGVLTLIDAILAAR